MVVVSGVLLAGLLGGCASICPLVATSQQSTSKLSEKIDGLFAGILRVRRTNLATALQAETLRARSRTPVGYGVFRNQWPECRIGRNARTGVVFDKRGKPTYMQLARTDIDPKSTVKPYRQVRFSAIRAN